MANVRRTKTSQKIRAIVPREDIEPVIDELRIKHPLVTDRQAEIVRLILHGGYSVQRVATALGLSDQTVRYHMEKDHVGEYRTALAMQAVGWDAALAQETLRSLLRAKSDYIRLEAAKDLTARAGLSVARAATPAVAVQMNFGVTTPIAQPYLAGSAEPVEGSGDGKSTTEVET